MDRCSYTLLYMKGKKFTWVDVAISYCVLDRRKVYIGRQKISMKRKTFYFLFFCIKLQYLQKLPFKKLTNSLLKQNKNNM